MVLTIENKQTFLKIRPTCSRQQIRKYTDLQKNMLVRECWREGWEVKQRTIKIVSSVHEDGRGHRFVLVNRTPADTHATLERMYLSDWSLEPSINGLWKKKTKWVEKIK